MHRRVCVQARVQKPEGEESGPKAENICRKSRAKDTAAWRLLQAASPAKRARFTTAVPSGGSLVLLIALKKQCHIAILFSVAADHNLAGPLLGNASRAVSMPATTQDPDEVQQLLRPPLSPVTVVGRVVHVSGVQGTYPQTTVVLQVKSPTNTLLCVRLNCNVTVVVRILCSVLSGLCQRSCT